MTRKIKTAAQMRWEKWVNCYNDVAASNPEAAPYAISTEVARRMKVTPQAIYVRMTTLGVIKKQEKR